MAFQEWMFDKRVVDRNIRRGLVTRADHDRYLKSLSDLSGQIATMEDDEREAARPKEGGVGPSGGTEPADE